MELPNMLPYDGIVNYYGMVMDAATAHDYLNTLIDTIAWKHDEARIFGRHIITRRKVAWYGDTDFSYAYSGTARVALPWTPQLSALKTLTETLTGENYNSCLLNLYHTGDEGMAWHSDDEKTLCKGSAIASLSFGAVRKFMLKHRTDKTEVRYVMLEPGSLLVMKGSTQHCWLHSLLKQRMVKTPRVNLTFRKML